MQRVRVGVVRRERRGDLVGATEPSSPAKPGSGRVRTPPWSQVPVARARAPARAYASRGSRVPERRFGWRWGRRVEGMSGFDDATWQALGLVLTLLGLGDVGVRLDAARGGERAARASPGACCRWRPGSPARCGSPGTSSTRSAPGPPASCSARSCGSASSSPASRWSCSSSPASSAAARALRRPKAARRERSEGRHLPAKAPQGPEGAAARPRRASRAWRTSRRSCASTGSADRIS